MVQIGLPEEIQDELALYFIQLDLDKRKNSTAWCLLKCIAPNSVKEDLRA